MDHIIIDDEINDLPINLFTQRVTAGDFINNELLLHHKLDTRYPKIIAWDQNDIYWPNNLQYGIGLSFINWVDKNTTRVYGGLGEDVPYVTFSIYG